MGSLRIVSILLAVATLCGADEVRLKDGSRVEGRIVEESADEIVLETSEGRRSIPRKQIEGVTRDDASVEVVLKSGRVIRGQVIRENNSTLLLQTAFSQVEISKINIETVNGKPAFGSAAVPVEARPEDVHPEEVLIPAGAFLMGDSREKESPVHKVHLDAYWIDKYEVTCAQYRKFLESTGRPEPRYWQDPRFSEDAQPVVGVTWEDARDYCVWAKKRLPTEAEWEKAARGEQSRLYPWGDAYNPTFANTRKSKKKRPMPVGTYPAGVSPYGVHDMAGNVWEWCRDWHGKDYYSTSPARNPTGPKEGELRAVRGGGWNARHVAMSHRRGVKPDKPDHALGFRCARMQ